MDTYQDYQEAHQDPTPPPTTPATPISGASASLTFSGSVQLSVNPTELTDATIAPSTSGAFQSYTFNQVMTAICGGLGDEDGFTDGNGRQIPKPGTYSVPDTLVKAHWALVSIAAGLDFYADQVDQARKTITHTWKGPAADAFTKVIEAFTTYLRSLSKAISPFVESKNQNLLTIAEELDLAMQALGSIWAASACPGGHDRSATVTIDTGPADLVMSPGKTMTVAAQTILQKLDTLYGKVLEK